VFRSDKHIYAQLIADDKGVTLGSVSTLKFKSADFDEKVSSKSVKAAFLVGFELGKEAKKLGLSSAIFDRNGKRYSGRLKALAEGIRESGIQI
jgi:large subunit ribosomal protein L18